MDQMRLLIIFTFLSTLLCCSDYSQPTHWPVNGTVIQKIKWQLPLEDSLNVLQKDGYRWMLPEPSDRIEKQTQTSSFRAPELTQYSEYLGRVDQEAVHSNQPNSVEFYRFEGNDVLFLGFTTPDTTKPLVMFDPPLVVMPGNLFDLKKDYVSTTTMKKFDKTRNEFIQGDKTKLTIRKLDSGFIDDKNTLAYLFEIKITSDKTIQFGESGLLVPEAVLLKSKILISEEGSLFEWQVKSRPAGRSISEGGLARSEEQVKMENEKPEEMPGKNDRMEEVDFYLELTKNIK